MAALALISAPAAASGATRYVDFDTGDDQAGTNLCLVQGAPCKTIANALTAAGGTADQILVDDDTYPESNLTVGNGITMRGMDFASGDSGATILDPGSSANPVIVTAPAQAATVRRFTLRNDSARLIEVNGPATISDNRFDEANVGSPTPHLLLTALAGNATISGNVFDKATEAGTAIRSLSTGSPTITGNQIASYNGGIDLRAGTPQVSGNEISEQTGAGSCDPCAGIFIFEAQATVIGNALHDPISTTGSAIGLTEFAAGGATIGTLERNVISGGGTGIRVFESGGTATLSMFGDLITGYGTSGLNNQNGDLSATNVTVASSAPGVVADAELFNANLVLDSSIVSNTGITTTPMSACAISFSRGPATGTPGDLTDCNDYQTIADPMFTGGSDFHLLEGSSMIDAGNPAAPPVGSTDIDDDPRGLSMTGTCSGPVAGRRDIGADEFVPGVPASCTLPPTIDPSPDIAPIPLNPPSTAKKKKCKKKRGKKGVVAAKKCKRKKSKR